MAGYIGFIIFGVFTETPGVSTKMTGVVTEMAGVSTGNQKILPVR